MSRCFAGLHGGPGLAAEAVAGLAPGPRRAFEAPGLAVAYTGPIAGASLCLLDGRLDNLAELREELGAGTGSAGGGEEAVLRAGFARWGEGLLGRLRGDFALLVWDEQQGRGLLARDQLGARPLFVREAGPLLWFAGEVSELLRLLPCAPAPDELGIAHWLALGSRPDDGTLYEGVRRLGPGEAILLERASWRRHRYWRPAYREPLSAPEPELAWLIGSGLERAISRRLDRHAKTAVLMSGGLDSASVAALGGPGLLACSGVFPEHPAADEAALLGPLRERLALPGLIAEVRPGGLLASAAEHLDAWRLPLLGWGDFWTLPLMRAARERGVGTVLGGDGGDEVFGARAYVIADSLRRGRLSEIVASARRLPGRAHASRRQELRMVARLALGAAPPFGPTRLRAPLLRRRLPAWVDRRVVGAVAASADPDAWKRLDGPRWWASAAHDVLHGIEAAGVFEHQRRRARLAGVEARHPMLDLDLIELALRVPPEATLDPRFSRPLLRSAVAGVLPDAVRLRPQKALFESLVASCLRGPEAVAVRQLLGGADAEVGAYVDTAKMRADLFGSDLVERDPFGWMWSVWRLANLELWLRSQSGAPLPAALRGELSEPRVSIADAGSAPTFFPLDRPARPSRLQQEPTGRPIPGENGPKVATDKE